MIDHFTSTVEGAAAFERAFGEEHFEDVDEDRSPATKFCGERRESTDDDGVVWIESCRLDEQHDGQHEPSEWTRRRKPSAEEVAAWGPAPF